MRLILKEACYKRLSFLIASSKIARWLAAVVHLAIRPTRHCPRAATGGGRKTLPIYTTGLKQKERDLCTEDMGPSFSDAITGWAGW